MSYTYLAAFLITAGLNAGTQLLLKKASLVLAPVFTSPEPLAMKLIRVALNPFVIGAVALLGTGMFIWIRLVSRVDLSRAYPINIALTVVITTIASLFLFQEGMTFMKFGGILLTLAGVWAIFYS